MFKRYLSINYVFLILLIIQVLLSVSALILAYRHPIIHLLISAANVILVEECRCDFLEQAGIPYPYIESCGILIPVLSVESKFVRPLRYGDTFAVYPCVTRFNGVRLELSYKVVNRTNGELCNESKSSHCFTDESLKPIRLKLKYPEIYKVFAEYVDYVIEE